MTGPDTPPSPSLTPRLSDPTTSLAVRGLSRFTAPLWVKMMIFVLIFLSWIPLALAVRARTDMNKPQPRIHIFQDMDNQPKFKSQQASLVFADGRADRPVVPGTVARGRLEADAHFQLGYAPGPDGAPPRDAQGYSVFFDTFPASLTIDDALLLRGRQVYTITCSLCHGADGLGNGPIHQRAVAAGAGSTGWNQPTDLTSEQVRQRTHGHLYNTINNGIRSMAGLGTQITPRDRWAVVAYVRALQTHAGVPADQLGPEDRERLD
jgi:mono/diheme cytochrome c family protein